MLTWSLFKTYCLIIQGRPWWQVHGELGYIHSQCSIFQETKHTHYEMRSCVILLIEEKNEFNIHFY